MAIWPGYRRSFCPARPQILAGVFVAPNLICIMGTGFKRIQPEMNLGMDLSKEYEMAERLARRSWHDDQNCG